jgi:hypothetical protein
VDNNYLDLGMNKSGFVHTLPGGRLNVNHWIISTKRVTRSTPPNLSS